ncbi:MAG: Uma2 family endonuclease, partial [Ardenticatenaceae bacterium]
STGVVGDSSAGFILPNGAMRSPDASWVRRTRLAALSEEQRQRFLPLCPDFVIELRSPTDALSTLQQKMQEYIANGAQLGWLIDPQRRQVHIYQPEQEALTLDHPASLSGDPILPGFVLDLKLIWEPPW